jgi:hypothetical protein
MQRSTLLTSPRSQLDFVGRLLFFALAPLAVVFVALLFPVFGTLASVALALAVFAAGETVRGWATRWWLVRKLMERELAPLDRAEPDEAAVLGIALDYHATAHDAVYIALCLGRGLPLVTAERTTSPWVVKLGRRVHLVR